VTIAAGGVRLRVRVTPRASAARIGGVELNDAGEAALKVYVTAAPEDGKANAALIRLLAKSWRLPKTSIEIAAGLTDRRKILHIEGDAGALLRAIEQRLSIGGNHDR
jgi:uncharacterized protein (TIGR00251 family)